MPASRFLKYTGRNWPNPVCSFYLPVSTSRDDPVEWETRAEDVALSLDAIKRCLSSMLVALDRDTPQTKDGLALPINFSTQELIITQEPPWLWFTLPELGFPLLTDEYRRPIHPEIEEYMRRHVSNDQDWEQVTETMKIAGESIIRNLRYTSEKSSRPSSTLGGRSNLRKKRMR